MKTNDSLIYSKRYTTIDEEYMRDHMFEDADSVISILKKTITDRIGTHTSTNFTEQNGSPPIIQYVPDITRMERSESFISEIKHFSETYHVSADIFREKNKINGWLYFGTDFLVAAKKEDFIELLVFADEVTGIPRPKGMEDWCDIAVIIDFMTHHSFVDGRELHPFI